MDADIVVKTERKKRARLRQDDAGLSARREASL
jgi:hypothetical protein